MNALVICVAAILAEPTIEFTVVDDEAIGYATFQSHNQKVAGNEHGIFITHLKTRNGPYTAQHWRLLRSTDGGKSFSVVHEATDATNPPTLETDSAGNIYLMRMDFTTGEAFLYRFLVENDYNDPIITAIPRGAAGKYATMIDEPRGLLYHFAHNNTFHTLNLDGELLSTVDLLQHGEHAVLQYPQLATDADGRLHAAWTTQKHGVYMYWDIHHMLRDGPDAPWRNMNGGTMTPPIIADDTGPALRISLDDEYESHTWLSSFVPKGGKVHFAYLAQTDPSREHYMRYDTTTGDRDVHLHPRFGGEKTEVRSLDGFFTTADASATSPVYFASSHAGHVVILRSGDNGATWTDYAQSEEAFNVYSIGGLRRLHGGRIIGTFTDQDGSNEASQGQSTVYFFSIAAE